MSDDIVEELPTESLPQAEYDYKFIYKPELLETIKEMIQESTDAMKINNNYNNDMLEGRVAALKELAVVLELATYEELK